MLFLYAYLLRLCVITAIETGLVTQLTFANGLASLGNLGSKEETKLMFISLVCIINGVTAILFMLFDPDSSHFIVRTCMWTWYTSLRYLLRIFNP